MILKVIIVMLIQKTRDIRDTAIKSMDIRKTDTKVTDTIDTFPGPYSEIHCKFLRL